MQFRITAMSFQPDSCKLYKSLQVKSFSIGNTILNNPASSDVQQMMYFQEVMKPYDDQKTPMEGNM